MKKRAEFYTNDGKPFMVHGKHATISNLSDFPDHLYIPTVKNEQGELLNGIILNKFARLAVSDDGRINLYWLQKVREYES